MNQRTKEARYYSVAGAEEYSAMSSAEGSVQQFSYNATFPLLLNIEGQPTYFMALKDDSRVNPYIIVLGNIIITDCSGSAAFLPENRVPESIVVFTIIIILFNELR